MRGTGGDRSTRPAGWPLRSDPTAGVPGGGRGRAALALGVAVLGGAVAVRAADRVDPVLWVPDLVVGWTFVAAGLVGRRGRASRAAGTLLVLTGAAWFLGSGPLLFVHRGVLVHALLAFPGHRPRSRLDAAAVVVAYGTGVVAPVWASDTATLALAAGLVAVAVRGLVVDRHPGRPSRRPGLVGALAVAGVLAAGAAARLALGADAVVPALLAYEAVLGAVAVGLAAGLARPSTARVADLVVELGEERSGTLRDRLARALGDPDLVVGHWSARAEAYLDDAGEVVALPAPGTARAATRVDRDDEPFAILVHDAPVLTDPALVTAVAAATRLSAANAALQAEVGEQVRELTASRRRLLLAADQARGDLDGRLRRGPEQQLAAVEGVLRTAVTSGPAPTDAHLARALGHVGHAREGLLELARGLHPRDLARTGLLPALEALGTRAPLPVDVRVTARLLPSDLRATLYFVCAEALVNAAKHAGATRVRIDVVVDGREVVVTVSDDGRGGADPARGTGLRGLSDRVEALGGRLTVTGPPGRGTRLVAEIPLDDEAR